MAGLKEVKGRIVSVISTQQITKAMKMVSASKLKKSQDRIIQMRPYAKRFSEVLRNVSKEEEAQDAWYNTAREEEKILILVVSSDRGLCGSFNSNIIKATIQRIQERYQEQYERGSIVILPIGRKSYEYFKKRNYKIEKEYWDLFQRLSFYNVSDVVDFLIHAFKKKRYDKIELVYNEFKNVATQIIRHENFLPVLLPEEDTTNKVPMNYIYQPECEKVVGEFIPKFLRIQLFKALLDSNASEHGARMTAMGQASDNAGALLKDLKLMYNRTRQAAITKEILEIVGGAEALKSG